MPATALTHRVTRRLSGWDSRCRPVSTIHAGVSHSRHSGFRVVYTVAQDAGATWGPSLERDASTTTGTHLGATGGRTASHLGAACTTRSQDKRPGRSLFSCVEPDMVYQCVHRWIYRWTQEWDYRWVPHCDNRLLHQWTTNWSLGSVIRSSGRASSHLRVGRHNQSGASADRRLHPPSQPSSRSDQTSCKRPCSVSSYMSGSLCRLGLTSSQCLRSDVAMCRVLRIGVSEAKHTYLPFSPCLVRCGITSVPRGVCPCSERKLMRGTRAYSALHATSYQSEHQSRRLASVKVSYVCRSKRSKAVAPDTSS